MSYGSIEGVDQSERERLSLPGIEQEKPHTAFSFCPLSKEHQICDQSLALDSIPPGLVSMTE
jgi:hypothetical protein